MLVHKRAALLCVTLKAGLISAQEAKAGAIECLLNIRCCAFNCDPLVRVVTVAATHFPFGHRMMMRQLELCANIQMTLKARFRRLSRIYDRASSTAGFDMQTPWPVTRLAAHVLGVFTFCLQSRVRGCSEIAHDLFVAGCAFFRADELRAWDAGRSENRSVGSAARKQNHCQRDGSSGTPQQTLAPSTDPSS
jgi:hypothetical protein